MLMPDDDDADVPDDEAKGLVVGEEIRVSDQVVQDTVNLNRLNRSINPNQQACKL